MELPSLNGKTSLAISLSSLVGLASAAAVVVRDRIEIGATLAEQRERLDQARRDLESLMAPGGRTVMAVETRERFAAIERRLDRCEEQIQLRGR